MSPPASRTSWKTQPPPPAEARERLPYERRFDAAEQQRLLRGLVPDQMEDKWFIFHEDGWLYFHRSWTGLCIYGVRLRPEGAGSAVEEAWVNRAPDQYARTDSDYDTRLLAYLVDRLLLGANDTPFPMPSRLAGTDKEAAYQHHVVGHARSGADGDDSN
jgi:hypothetical protein